MYPVLACRSTKCQSTQCWQWLNRHSHSTRNFANKLGSPFQFCRPDRRSKSMWRPSMYIQSTGSSYERCPTAEFVSPHDAQRVPLQRWIEKIPSLLWDSESLHCKSEIQLSSCLAENRRMVLQESLRGQEFQISSGSHHNDLALGLEQDLKHLNCQPSEPMCQQPMSLPLQCILPSGCNLIPGSWHSDPCL